jgi:DNA mismatch repair ATPase MutL
MSHIHGNVHADGGVDVHALQESKKRKAAVALNATAADAAAAKKQAVTPQQQKQQQQAKPAAQEQPKQQKQQQQQQTPASKQQQKQQQTPADKQQQQKTPADKQQQKQQKQAQQTPGSTPGMLLLLCLQRACCAPAIQLLGSVTPLSNTDVTVQPHMQLLVCTGHLKQLRHARRMYDTNVTHPVPVFTCFAPCSSSSRHTFCPVSAGWQEECACV